MSEQRLFIYIYFALLALVAVTVALAFLPLGRMNLPAAFLVAGLKAYLIALFYMEVRHSLPVTKLSIVVSLIWLAMFTILSFADYLTRDWPVNPGVVARPSLKQPPIVGAK